MNYYNEHDRYAAAWLRNLIADNQIAPGVVDERDIRDIRPGELLGYTQCHFFAGIGGWSKALRLAGIPDDKPIWTGSCPCQPFSAAGAGNGFTDERHLWPAWFHLISQCKPPKIYGEQVASPDALKWFDLVLPDLEASGYAVGVADICAASVGSPHIRQRLWFVADSQQFQREGCDSEHGIVSLAQGRRATTELAGLGGVVALADSNINRCAALPVTGFRANAECDAESCRCAELMGNASSARGEAGLPEPQERQGGQPRVANNASCECVSTGQRPENGGSSGLGNTDSQSTGRYTGSPHTTQAEYGSGSRNDHGLGYAGSSVDTWPSPLHGFWRDADWLFCRDGKWRPVEPGLEPLVNGVSNRVGRLRAYGNAIVPQVAAAFIEATA